MENPAANETEKYAICQFFRLIPDASEPTRADRSAGGTLPVNAYRYCEAIASASGFGWYLYPPLSFSLIWDGSEIAWTYGRSKRWYPLRAAQFPGFVQHFKKSAPASLSGLAPPFLVQGLLPGVVQIWSGYLARTAPGWSLLSRGIANLSKSQPYENFEGLIETGTWFGPLFTNVRLTRTNSPVNFHKRYPLFQVQPLKRECYQQPAYRIFEAADLNVEDWRRFEETVRPNTDQMRRLGHYAVNTRRAVTAQGRSRSRDTDATLSTASERGNFGPKIQ